MPLLIALGSSSENLVSSSELCIVTSVAHRVGEQLRVGLLVVDAAPAHAVPGPAPALQHPAGYN